MLLSLTAVNLFPGEYPVMLQIMSKYWCCRLVNTNMARACRKIEKKRWNCIARQPDWVRRRGNMHWDGCMPMDVVLSVMTVLLLAFFKGDVALVAAACNAGKGRPRNIATFRLIQKL